MQKLNGGKGRDITFICLGIRVVSQLQFPCNSESFITQEMKQFQLYIWSNMSVIKHSLTNSKQCQIASRQLTKLKLLMLVTTVRSIHGNNQVMSGFKRINGFLYTNNLKWWRLSIMIRKRWNIKSQVLKQLLCKILLTVSEVGFKSSTFVDGQCKNEASSSWCCSCCKNYEIIH